MNFIHTYLDLEGAPVCQWVKHWPTDLAVQGSSPACGEIFATVNGVSFHTAFHHPDMTEILLKKTSNRKSSMYPYCELELLIKCSLGDNIIH